MKIQYFLHLFSPLCLNLSDTNLTATSITSIINHLKQSLEILDICDCFEIDFEKVLELKSMPKLRVLNYGWRSWHTMILRKEIPHLEINEEGLGLYF